MKVLRALTALAVLVMLTCSPSLAAVTEPVVTTAVADTDTMTLKIEGFNLTEGALFMGKIGGGVQKLNVISSSPTAIEAVLPTNEPGSYLIVIAASASEFWTSSVTIGAVGPEGPQGAPGFSGYRRIVVTDGLIGGGGQENVTLNCNAGEKVISGGWNAVEKQVAAFRSYPASDTSWQINVFNHGVTQSAYDAWAICVAVAP